MVVGTYQELRLFNQLSSRKSKCHGRYQKLLSDMERAGIEMSMEEVQSYLNNLTLEPTLLEQIRVAQQTNAKLISIREEEVGEGKQPNFNIAKDGTLRYQNCLYVSNNFELKKIILSESHKLLYMIHPGSTKMYWDLWEQYWWNGMKKEVAQFVQQCLTCQRVKAEH